MRIPKNIETYILYILIYYIYKISYNTIIYIYRCQVSSPRHQLPGDIPRSTHPIVRHETYLNPSKTPPEDMRRYLMLEYT